jgi:hypothetical protein
MLLNGYTDPGGQRPLSENEAAPLGRLAHGVGCPLVGIASGVATCNLVVCPDD